MDDPKQTPDANPSTPPSTNPNWSEQRRAERMAHRAERQARREARGQGYGRYYSPLTGGIILIVLGVAFLLERMGILFQVNGWALFILLPAIGAYVGAWELYQHNGRLTRAAASSLTVAVLLTVLSLVFLLNLAVSVFWPALLILAGLALLMTTLIQA